MRGGLRLSLKEVDMKLILLGAPGAGKGTQAKKVAAAFNVPHISTGDIFRANIAAGTELGKKAKSYMDAGALVPDELTVGLLMDRISQDDCAGGYVLDGFPRSIPQAEKLTEALTASGQELDAAVNIDVPDEVIIGRMGGRRVCPKCGASFHVVAVPPKKEGICDACGAELIIRADDKEETVKARLNTYHEQTQPLIDYYKKAGKLIDIDGTQDPEKVFEDIIGKLK